ncbi:MAG TPA: tetratricopeptide repeat protein [Bryobacteraceae bacterium]|jgi:tetratricopeptide (TPR) repeat protein|nr:tetratricopeptide repeat protein [Bryobacteraceae bacterium]
MAMAQKTDVEAAWKLIGQGKREEAVTLLRGLIQANPRNADARLLLGSVLMEADQRSESIAQLREAVRLLPESAEAHNALGEAYNAFGETAAAKPEFERAVALDPRHAQAQLNLGDVLVQQNEAQAATLHLDQAILLFGQKPDAAYAHYLRGKIYIGERDAEKAVAELQQAIELRPDFPEAWSDLGSARKSLSDNAGAVTALRRAVALNPKDPVAQYRLGSELLDVGVAHEAVEHLEAAVRVDPKDQSALNALQRALRKDGQVERAEAVKKQLAKVIMERDQTDQKMIAAFELNDRGAELEKAGDVRGALEKYRAALELLPEHPGIRTNVAVALLKLGNWEEGISQMREALRRDPGDTKLQKALNDALAQAEAHGILLRKQ